MSQSQLRTPVKQVLPPRADQSVEDQQTRVRDLMLLRQAFSVLLEEQESDNEVLRVLVRAADDPNFIAELTHLGSEALEGYRLSPRAKAALLSGDIGWIEARVGELDARLRTWIDCRLQQEIC